MPVTPVIRPVVRSYLYRSLRDAAEHVRAGGHAIVWPNKKKAMLVFAAPAKGDHANLGAWAVYDLGKSRWQVHTRGVLKGLASTLVPRDCHDIVKHWASRDAIHYESTRQVAFDCTECAACCRDNEVILQDDDVQRFKDAGRGELAKPPYARRKDGRLTLTLLRSKSCRHLSSDKLCGIYDLRPRSCSEFPMGSECCLFARQDGLNVHDGLAPEWGDRAIDGDFEFAEEPWEKYADSATTS